MEHVQWRPLAAFKGNSPVVVRFWEIISIPGDMQTIQEIWSKFCYLKDMGN